VNPTTMPNTASTPTPIAIFFQGFMVSVTVRGYRNPGQQRPGSQALLPRSGR
jgi:hypothetical protein